MSQMQERSVAERLEQGKAAVQARDIARGREILEPLVEEEPENPEAWLWLSGAQTSPAEMARCLRQVLRIEPGNQDAIDTLAWLQAKHGPAAIAPPEVPATAPDRPGPVQPSPPHTGDQAPMVDVGATDTAPSAHGSAAAAPASAEDTRLFRAPGSSAPQQTRPAAAPSHAGSRIYPSSPYAKPVDRRQLLEHGLLVGGVGALLGLLRLAGQLRPGTLLLIRGSDGPIGLAGALGVAAATAVLHGLALVAAWLVLGRTVATARNDRPSDLGDSLVRLAAIFWPGYAAVAALLLVALTLGAGERRWTPVVVLVWIILLGAAVAAGRRLKDRMDAFRVGGERQEVILVRIVLPALLVALAGLGIAGLLARRLLAAI